MCQWRPSWSSCWVGHGLGTKGFSKVGDVVELTTEDQRNPSDLWMCKCVYVCVWWSVPASREGLWTLGLLYPDVSNQGDWDPGAGEIHPVHVCLYILTNMPPPCSARQESRMRLLGLSVFVWVFCVLSAWPAVYISGVSMCLLGTHAQSALLLVGPGAMELRKHRLS